MLVLARMPGQKIYVGDDVIIEVVVIEGNKVRLGISAPRDVTVYRDELLTASVRSQIERNAAQPTRSE